MNFRSTIRHSSSGSARLFGSRRDLPCNKPFSVEISGPRKIEIDYKRNPFVTPLYIQDLTIIVLPFQKYGGRETRIYAHTDGRTSDREWQVLCNDIREKLIESLRNESFNFNSWLACSLPCFVIHFPKSVIDHLEIGTG